MRRSLIAAAAMALIAGPIFAGCGSGGSGSTGGTTGTPDVIVHAKSALKFDKDSYSASAGSVTLKYIDDDNALHTLEIDGKSGFKLKVSSKGDTDADSVQLAAGTYTIYCNVPGHRSAGMEAKLTIG
jgi:plastocyanin